MIIKEYNKEGKEKKFQK